MTPAGPPAREWTRSSSPTTVAGSRTMCPRPWRCCRASRTRSGTGSRCSSTRGSGGAATSPPPWRSGPGPSWSAALTCTGSPRPGNPASGTPSTSSRANCGARWRCAARPRSRTSTGPSSARPGRRGPGEHRERGTPGRSAGQLALALLDLAEDLAVAAVHVTRHAPHVHGPETAHHADPEEGGVWAAAVAPPLAAVAGNGHAADVHADPFGHVDVRVAEGTGRDRPPAQPEPAAPRDVPEQGRGEPRCPAARTGRRRGRRGQVFLDAGQVPAHPGPEGILNPLGEFVGRQAARQQVLAEGDHGLLTVSIRNPDGRIVHS